MQWTIILNSLKSLIEAIFWFCVSIGISNNYYNMFCYFYVKSGIPTLCVFAAPVTTPAPCEDKLPTCAALQSQCSNPNFAATLKQNCKKTCGYCGEFSLYMLIWNANPCTIFIIVRTRFLKRYKRPTNKKSCSHELNKCKAICFSSYIAF